MVLIPPEEYLSLPTCAACNLGRAPRKDFSFLLLYAASRCSKVTSLVCEPSSFVSDGGVQAGRSGMTRPAVYFIPEQRGLISPVMTFYSVKAWRLHFTLTVFRWLHGSVYHHYQPRSGFSCPGSGAVVPCAAGRYRRIHGLKFHPEDFKPQMQILMLQQNSYYRKSCCALMYSRCTSATVDLCDKKLSVSSESCEIKDI